MVLRISSFSVAFVLLTFTYVQALPTNWESPSPQGRQEDDDDPQTTPLNFGTHVAQIITGAFTGNIDSIIKGSFGFIQEPEVSQLSHNTWETLKGNPTTRPVGGPAPTTEEVVEVLATEPATSPPVVQSAPEVAAPASFPSSGSGSVVFSPQDTKTQSPTRVKAQTNKPPGPGAPLQVFESIVGTEPEPLALLEQSTAATVSTSDFDDEQSTAATVSTSDVDDEQSTAATVSTSDVDDEDEEGTSVEEVNSSTSSSANIIEAETASSSADNDTTTSDTLVESEGTTASETETESDVGTTTEDDDQDQVENLYESFF